MITNLTSGERIDLRNISRIGQEVFSDRKRPKHPIILDRRVSLSRRDFLQGATIVAGVHCWPQLAQAAEEGPVTKVHVVFKTHLDIGFTDLAAGVIRQYLDIFIPKALRLAESTRRTHSDHRFRWTTGSWLINKYLEEADRSGRNRMEQAIEVGDVCWHALPFTLHCEALHPSLFELGLKLSARLDDRFGRKTIAAKITDVPSHTRSIVPLLQNAGVQFLHIGVNPASTPPAVPPVFIWEPPDGSRLAVMIHADYGGVLRIPHSSHVAAIVLTGDNHGPQTEEAVHAIYERLANRFPGAEVIASDLNAIGREVVANSSRLPVVKSELGDSWIHGTGSDPKKIAQLRELSRLRSKWIHSRTFQEGSSEDLAFGIPLAMIAEHTWGLDIKTHLGSWDTYTPEDLRAARKTKRFQRVETSWQEKSNYIEEAIASLPLPLAREARKTLVGLKPKYPDLRAFQKIKKPDRSIETPLFSIALDTETGALRSLQNRKTGRQWASADNPLALFAYQSFSQADYDRYQNQYLVERPEWALKDFGKPGINQFNPRSQTTLARLKSAWIKEEEKTCFILTEMEVLDEMGNAIPGCPKRLTLEYSLSNTEPTIEVTLQWFDKQATRLPEALWLSFVPLVEKEGSWRMDKMGQEVDPRDVVKDGGRKMHAVTENIRYGDRRGNLTIQTLDAHLVAPAERTLLNFDNAVPATRDGMHFCLLNNVWGTNFVMWFDENMRFRFRLRFDAR